MMPGTTVGGSGRSHESSAAPDAPKDTTATVANDVEPPIAARRTAPNCEEPHQGNLRNSADFR